MIIFGIHPETRIEIEVLGGQNKIQSYDPHPKPVKKSNPLSDDQHIRNIQEHPV